MATKKTTYLNKLASAIAENPLLLAQLKTDPKGALTSVLGTAAEQLSEDDIEELVGGAQGLLAKTDVGKKLKKKGVNVKDSKITSAVSSVGATLAGKKKTDSSSSTASDLLSSVDVSSVVSGLGSLLGGSSKKTTSSKKKTTTSSKKKTTTSSKKKTTSTAKKKTTSSKKKTSK